MIPNQPTSSVDGFILSTLKSVDWNDGRKKLWQMTLVLAAAYVSAHPERYAWAVPVLTAWAGVSQAPFGKERGSINGK